MDDNPELRGLIQYACASQDLPADEAIDGRDAIEKFSLKSYPVVVTDIQMPGMNGLALTRWIKTHFKDTYVIVITGYPDQYLWNQIAEAGADDFLVKPFNIHQMILKIKSIIRFKSKINHIAQELDEIMAISNDMIGGLQHEAMASNQRIRELEKQIEAMRLQASR